MPDCTRDLRAAYTTGEGIARFPFARLVRGVLRTLFMMFLAMSKWVRELRAPGSKEVVGAVAQGGVALLPERGVLEPAAVGNLLEQAERQLREAPEVHGREVVLVDDGGYSAVAAVVAVAALRELGASRVILAGSSALCAELHEVVDGLLEIIPGPLASTERRTATATSPRI